MEKASEAVTRLVPTYAHIPSFNTFKIPHYAPIPTVNPHLPTSAPSIRSHAQIFSSSCQAILSTSPGLPQNLTLITIDRDQKGIPSMDIDEDLNKIREAGGGWHLVEAYGFDQGTSKSEGVIHTLW